MRRQKPNDQASRSGSDSGRVLFPVESLVPELASTLIGGRSAVVTAPPGTGKSTVMPAALLDRLPGRILVTQPRRLATRMLAARTAQLRQGEVGGEVGFAVRGERREGSATRLLYLTEGLLLRRLLAGANGGASEADVVVLDEFHERSIDADLLLGVLRDRGIRLVVASATLDAAGIAASLGAVPLSVNARLHPVTVSHRKAPSVDPVWNLAAEAVASVLADPDDDGGDILVFMPGRREIERTIETCARVARALEIRPLHGGLSGGEQDRAVSDRGPRRIVVATNIAETSITIPRVTVVIDAGLARIDRFDPGRDLPSLTTEPVDRASAVQRAGRAGRLRPGRCIRLYTESQFLRRPAARIPATARADLAEAFLRLRAANLDPDSFAWIEPPPSEAVRHAEKTLAAIDAVEDGRLTDAGRRIASLPLPPRVGRFLVDALDAGGGRFAAACAAVLGERELAPKMSPATLDGFRRAEDPEGDLAARARLIMDGKARPRGADEGALVDARRTAAELERTFKIRNDGEPGVVIPALLTAFPDRVAFRRADARDACALPGRRQAVLERDSLVRRAGFLVAAAIRGLETRGEGMTILSLATAIPESVAIETLGGRLSEGRRFELDVETGRMETVEHRRLDDTDIETRRGPVGPGDRAGAAAAMLVLVESGEISIPGWDEEVESFLERVRRTAEWFPKRGLPIFDEEELMVMRAEIVGSKHRLADLPNATRIIEILRSALDWNDATFVDEAAPSRISLPRGRSMRVAWKAGEPPRGSARIGDLIGLERTPSVAKGRVPVLLEILAPNRRPVQVTDDLPGFWNRTYPELKKELKRRYPKHPWP